MPVCGFVFVMEQQNCRVFEILLEKVVNDIFDSSASGSDSSSEEEPDKDNNQRDLDNEPLLLRLRKNSSTMHSEDIQSKQAFVDALLLTCSNEEFKEYFKVSRETFEFILKFIQYDLWRGSKGQDPLPPELQLLLTLRKMSSSDSYCEVCKIFKVRKETATRTVQRVVLALSNRASKFILWPTGVRVPDVCKGFQTLSKIQKVIGALDSILVSITNHSEIITEKYSQSALLQVVVDDQGRFTFCSVGAVGKNEKQEVFNDSILQNFVSKPMERFPNNCHLVAGQDYELHEHVIVPYNGTSVTIQQKTFNEYLKLAHNCATKTISALKMRFPSLSSTLDVERWELAPTYLKACCVLYNISVDRGDLLDDPPYYVTQELHGGLPGTHSVASVKALQKRDLLCKQLHMSEAGVFFV